jgi:hypothetical protein
MYVTTDVELLISRLSYPLDPADRPAFRHAAEIALAAPGCWGEGSIYRCLVPLWRNYFHPPSDDRAAWGIEQEPRTSKLISAPPLEH